MPYKKAPRIAGQIDTGPLTGPFSGFRNRMPDLFISTGIHDHLHRVIGQFSRNYLFFRDLLTFKGDPGYLNP